LDALGTTTEETSLSAKRPGEPLNVFYSIKLTQTQRIKLLQLGGPEWIRNQIERSTELPGLGESNAGQIRSGQLHQDAAAGRGD
tara:strand:+ start:1190 stop:1441 length:252 start_codon:yes stop_codon:yes gene_type:complete